MKVISATLSFMLLTGILAGCSASGSSPPDIVSGNFHKEAYVSYEGEYTPSDPPTDMELVAHKGYTAMFYNPETAAFALNDMRTGEFYFSIPEDAEISAEKSHLLVKDVDDTDNTVKNKYSSDATITTKKAADGFQVWYAFPEEKYAIPVEYLLCEDGLRVRIRCDQMIEQGNYRVFEVSILPFLYAQRGFPEGFILVPDGSGAVIKLNTEKSHYLPYSSPLYGDSYLSSPDYISSVQENSLLPFAGLQSEKGGLLIFAENGAANSTIFAAAEDQDSAFAHTYFKFELRKQQNAYIGNPESFHAKSVVISEKGPVAIKDISVRYFLLDSNPQDGLGKMAETARNITMRETEKISPTSHNAFYITTLGGYTENRSILGIQAETTKPVTDFQAAAHMIEELKQAGADKTALIYTGYNKTFMRGGITGNLKPDRRLGSVNELAELSENLGAGRLLLVVDPVTFYQNGSGINVNKNAIRDLNLSTVLLYRYKRNTFQPDKSTGHYLLKTDRATNFLQQSQEWINQNVPLANILVKGFSEKLYGDYSENGYSRVQALENVHHTLRTMSAQKPICSVSANYDAALFSSVIVNAPASSSRYDLLDESVPFYQMVFSGKRQMVSPPINTSGDPGQMFLNSVRFGMIPHYELVAQELEIPGAHGLDSFYSSNFASWESEVIKRYQQYFPIYESINGRNFIDYRVIENDVYELTYSGDVKVRINMSQKDVKIDKKAIGAGQISVEKGG